MTDTLKTTLRTFHFDRSSAQGRADWQAFQAARKAEGFPRAMESLGNMTRREPGAGFYYLPHLDGAAVELETAHLFDNQWNAAPIPGDTTDKGRRLFDWAIEVDYSGANRSPWRQGHYLEQTPEMREARRNTCVCGYCGHQEASARGSVFCPKCIGSEYLKESDLHLTRMLPVRDSFNTTRAPLTEAERAHLLPLYIEAQRRGTGERSDAYRAKIRSAVIERHAKATETATAERDGFLWLLDRGASGAILENTIFYGHTGRFGFGWRSALDAAQLAALLDLMGAEFRFPYDIKCADGRTLSGEG